VKLRAFTLRESFKRFVSCSPRRDTSAARRIDLRRLLGPAAVLVLAICVTAAHGSAQHAPPGRHGPRRAPWSAGWWPS